jgi:surface carbohydrate biosynthesis protein (TIGR04326 family)
MSKHKTILWSQYNLENSIDQISIPEFIEKNASSLKTRYLAWIYDLGLAKISTSTVIKKLKIRENLSYWWMTPLAEKFNFSRSPQITDAIRIMAFEEWNRSAQIKSMMLVTNNINLVESLQIYCRDKYIEFEWCRSPDSVVKKSFKSKIYGIVPSRVKAIVWLLQYFTKRWSCRSIGISEWRNSKAKITFFSYFDYQIYNTTLEGGPESNYWGGLPRILQAANKQSNWLHILADSSKLFGANSAQTLIKQLNNSNSSNQNHVLLDSFLSFRIFFKTIKDWCYIQNQLKKVEKVLSCTHSEDLQIWPFFRNEYEKTSQGIRAIENILNLNLFEKACSLLPEQNIGVYLFEQQPWEFALISSWKSNKHKKLIGAQHTTVLFWDLRYFNDPKVYTDVGPLHLPTPDKIGVNGPLSMTTLSNSGYLKSNLILTEALRYQYIEKYRGKIKTKNKNKFVTVLVLGDYSLKNTYQQIKILEQAIDLINFEPRIIMRPHPFCPMDIGDFNILEATKLTLPELLVEVDMVYASASTSAAVDAYCMGVPVASVLEPEKLNLSPLRGIEGVSFVDTPKKLATFIEYIHEGDREPNDKIEFFTQDNKLSRWRNLLEF